MLTIQHIQEDLSRAYIQAVAAKAGVNLALGTQAHDYGVDGTFHQVEVLHRVNSEGMSYTRRLNSGFDLEFQCKASRNGKKVPGTLKRAVTLQPPLANKNVPSD